MNMKRKKIANYAFNAVVLTIAVLMLYPVLWLIFSSFKPNTDIFQTATELFPRTWTLDNYVTGFKGIGGIPFMKFIMNSLTIALISTVGAVVSSAIISYGFARIPFKTKGFWFACVLVTMMLPAEIIMVPQYLWYNFLGWVNTLLPVTAIYYFGQAFFIFMMVQFIQGIPVELDEAAKMDGCGRVQIFLRVIIPLLKPSLATTAIFSFYWRWEELIGPMLYLTRPDDFTVSVALKQFLDASSASNWGAMFAMSVISLLPVLIVFFMFQKYIVQGISTTGLK
ncbi:carbohydrate ABC transporter permease [Jeotgalibaca caeni]|uniref:carbohydrate ABC transporter permease n=1 Tax=Jeotgalibaca caeni TaxID=3028623 RepID=UPI00237D383C|nr:carbohydrate ABC transporter permease [Jeotgalibaca caeni]MDE1548122.1 carbohydrate ABC transporter permease [Jeotgalibaca caeni]